MRLHEKNLNMTLCGLISKQKLVAYNDSKKYLAIKKHSEIFPIHLKMSRAGDANAVVDGCLSRLCL